MRRLAFRLMLHHFNPRSRKGSDYMGHVQRFAVLSISIHAPAKGATGHAKAYRMVCKISIHAPAKGATPNIDKILSPIQSIFVYKCF